MGDTAPDDLVSRTEAAARRLWCDRYVFRLPRRGTLGRDLALAGVAMVGGLLMLSLGAYRQMQPTFWGATPVPLFLLPLLVVCVAVALRRVAPRASLAVGVVALVADLALGGSLGTILIFTQVLYDACVYGPPTLWRHALRVSIALAVAGAAVGVALARQLNGLALGIPAVLILVLPVVTGAQRPPVPRPGRRRPRARRADRPAGRARPAAGRRRRTHPDGPRAARRRRQPPERGGHPRDRGAVGAHPRAGAGRGGAAGDPGEQRAGAGRDAADDRRAARPRGRGRARRAGDGPARGDRAARRPGPRRRAGGRARHDRRAPPAAGRRRPRRLPDRAGVADQRAAATAPARPRSRSTTAPTGWRSPWPTRCRPTAPRRRPTAPAPGSSACANARRSCRAGSTPGRTSRGGASTPNCPPWTGAE